MVSFEEEFPSLPREELQEWFLPVDFKELKFDNSVHMVGMSRKKLIDCCLDKQRVKEALDKFRGFEVDNSSKVCDWIWEELGL